MKDGRLLSIERLVREVYEENERQVSKWGIQNHTLYQWFCILSEEIGELAKTINEFDDLTNKGNARDLQLRNIRLEAIQGATLLLKIAEMVGIEEEK